MAEELNTEVKYSGATIRRIQEIRPIEGADAIELAIVDGWQVVVQKNKFKPSDLGVFISIDTWLPVNPAWAFLDKAPREFIGYGLGYRVKSIKLRKQLSQGLLLPFVDLGFSANAAEGNDVSVALGARHWEKPIPGSMRGRIQGNFPSFIPKTDQERVQNITKLLFDRKLPEPDWSKIPEEKHAEIKARITAGGEAQYAIADWEVTTKLDGSSITVFVKDGVPGVCSRNWQLDMSDTENVFVKTAIETGIVDILMTTGENMAVQGELVGPGIQHNPEGLKRPDIFIFDVYDIDAQKYLIPEHRRQVCLRLGLRHVPVQGQMVVQMTTVDELLEAAAVGESLINKSAEGFVWKHGEGELSFKVINNNYLLEKGE